MDALAAMQVFVAVCDAHGFAAASRRLGLSAPVVTRAVAGLERRLGARLLQRTTRSLHLTDAGARYLEHARRVLAEFEAAEDAARGDGATPRGTLIVSAPQAFGRMHVAERVRTYLARHPQARATLRLDDRNVNLVEDGVDVAVRVGTLADSTLVARAMGTTRRLVVASPAYLAAHGAPADPDALASHATVALDPGHAAPAWRFGVPGDPAGERWVGIDARLTTNSTDAGLAFVREGGGLVRALHYQVADDLAAGRLRTVLDEHEPPPAPIHLLLPSARLVPARVRAFLALALADAPRAY